MMGFSLMGIRTESRIIAYQRHYFTMHGRADNTPTHFIAGQARQVSLAEHTSTRAGVDTA